MRRFYKRLGILDDVLYNKLIFVMIVYVCLHLTRNQFLKKKKLNQSQMHGM